MRNKWIKRIFPFVALSLLLPWPVAYAYDVNVMDGQDTIRIQVAELSARPAWTAFGRAIGGVTTPGDLFYVDATNNGADIRTTPYLINTQELVGYYRYMTLNVGIYVENEDGEWEKASGSDGELISDRFITMRNGQVDFILPGYAKYKVTIDDGVFYCTNANAGDNSLSPRFHLEVD